MKIIIFLSVFFVSKYSLAQSTNLPQPNGNIINNSLTKFIGTWVWSNNGDTIKIILKKDNILLPFPENSRMDAIVGFHQYIKNSIKIESSITYFNSVYSDKHSTILGGNDNGNDTLVCTIKDVSKNKLNELRLVLNTNHTQLHWHLDNPEGVRVRNFDPTFTFPNNITLLKQ